jgi:hypothetical protein
MDIVVNAPASPPAGYGVYTKWGNDTWQGPATNFPFSFDATGQQNRELQYYAVATGRMQSPTMSDTYNTLTL